MKIKLLLLSSAVMSASGAFAGIPEGFDTESKWYTNFTNADNEFEWPAGSTYGSAISYKNNGTTSNPVFGVYSNTDPDDLTGFFITPKLKCAAGEKLIVESRCNSAYSDADGINVYVSATREGLADPQSRTLILKLAAASEDEATKLTNVVQQFETQIEEAGEYYIGFSRYNRGQINGIYGCELVELAHDWAINSGNFPKTAVQNNESTGYINIVNFGIKDEKASDYTVTIDIDGKTTVLPGEVDITAEHSLEGSGVAIPIKFRSPKVGTVAISATVTATDGYSVKSETMEVEILKETLSGEITVGNEGGTSGNVPFAGFYDNSETISLYTPEMLGLKSGDKIKSIYVKGYVGGNVVGTDSRLKLCYSWTNLSSLDKPDATSAYDSSIMTTVYDDTFHWETIGSSSDLQPVLVMNFNEPLVYEQGKSLLLLFHNERDKYKSGAYFETPSSNPKTSWTQKADNSGGQTGVYKGNWSAAETPTIHIELEITPRSLSGFVSARNEKISNAVLTLVSADDDDVEYEGVSADDGSFSIDVIQSDRIYDLKITAGEYAEFEDSLSFSESSMVRDFNLRRVVTISDDGNHKGGDDNAIVYLDKNFTPGYNMISLPIGLTADEFKELFGADAKVYTYTEDRQNTNVVVVNFLDYDGNLEAGHPYLIKISKDSVSGFWKSREAVEQLLDLNGSFVTLKSTSSPIDVEEGMYPITEDIFFDYPDGGDGGDNAQSEVDPLNINNLSEDDADNDETGEPDADELIVIPAYSAYIEAKPAAEGKIMITFNGQNINTGVQNIVIEKNQKDLIFDLQGRPVSKPSKGIYVVNGKLILVE